MGSFLEEFRQEMGITNQANNSKSSKQNIGGDHRIIDGPNDYAFSKLNSSNLRPYAPTGTSLSPNQGNFSSVHDPYLTIPQGYQNKNYHTNQYPNHLGYNQSKYPSGLHPQHQQRRETTSYGYQDNRSWISSSGQSFLSMGRHPGGYYPYPAPQNYIPPQFNQQQQYQSPQYHPQVHQYSPNKKQNCQENPWQNNQNKDLSISSELGNDHKKMVAQHQIRNMIDQKQSPVIHVKGLDSEDVTPEIIASLFGNFGNILKFLFLKKKQTALIEYLEVDSASVAREMLNNLIFFGSQLKVSYSTYLSVDENLTTSNNPEKYRDVFTPSPKTYRFKDTKKISINPPSKVLHLSNIAREVYSEEGITEIFSSQATVKKVKLINGPQEEKCMALVELDTLENALICISTLHNQVYFSR